MDYKNIEVEIRSFITKLQYEQFLEFFNQNAELVKQDYQETYYFDSEQDLRIQKNEQGSKIWLKKGQIHDDCRDELEIKFSKEDFDKANQIFQALDYSVEIKWFRTRHEFNWEGIKVCVDYTKGYGYIIELEKLSSVEEQEGVLDELRQKMNELKIQETSKEEFNKQYENYKQNWRELVNCK
ncbi:CYTH domain-containing protein [archaeon]|nr:CYTH domain-containing protein [archaeon]